MAKIQPEGIQPITETIIKIQESGANVSLSFKKKKSPNYNRRNDWIVAAVEGENVVLHRPEQNREGRVRRDLSIGDFVEQQARWVLSLENKASYSADRATSFGWFYKPARLNIREDELFGQYRHSEFRRNGITQEMVDLRNLYLQYHEMPQIPVA